MFCRCCLIVVGDPKIEKNRAPKFDFSAPWAEDGHVNPMRTRESTNGHTLFVVIATHSEAYVSGHPPPSLPSQDHRANPQGLVPNPPLSALSGPPNPHQR